MRPSPRGFLIWKLFLRNLLNYFLLIFASAYTSLHESGNRSAYTAAEVLGVQHVSSAAGADCGQFAGRARCLRGDADGRGKIAVLSVAGGGFGGTAVVISPLIALMQD